MHKPGFTYFSCCILFLLLTLANQTANSQVFHKRCNDDDSLRRNVRIGTFNVVWEKKLSERFSLAAQFQLGPNISKQNLGIPEYSLIFLPQINISSRYYFYSHKHALCGPYALFLLNYGKGSYHKNDLYSYFTITRIAHVGLGYQTGFWKYLFVEGNVSYGLSTSSRPGNRFLFHPGIELHFGAYLRKRK